MQKQSLLKNLIIIAFSACVAGIASFLFLKNLWPSNLLTASTINLSVPQTPSNAEKYINSTYPNSEKTRRALEQFAEAMETSLLDADNKEVSIVHRFERLRAFQCLLAFYPYLEARQMILNLKEMIVNTAEKAAAWCLLDEIRTFFEQNPDCEF